MLGIKQTLYRTSGDSPIVASLIRAAELGKQVATVVELRARFDEQANIGWAKALEEAGVHVVYGLVGLKTHSKTCLVVRREEDGIRRYCHIGTGNYNSKTARMYEDLGLLTSDEDIGSDLGDLFNHLTGFSRHADYRQILVSPVNTRDRMVELIEEQAAAGTGRPDRLQAERPYRPGRHRRPLPAPRWPGCRSTSSSGACARLRAGRAGAVRDHPGALGRRPVPRALAHLPLRRPGVRSDVGELAQRRRVDAGEAWPATSVPPPLRIYIGSSDLMRRNLDRRIEVLAPVHDRELVARLLEILDLALADDTNSWALGADGHLGPGARRSGRSASRSAEGARDRSGPGAAADIETRAQPTAG